MKNKKRKIAYISGTRADFGLMTSVLANINKSNKLKLCLYATGMHLMPEFGKTIDEIKKFFPEVVPIQAVFKTDDKFGAANFTGEFLVELIKILSKDKPNLVLTLGDRSEMLCAAIAALYLSIPTAHIHGGERTLTVDEINRHAITKLSHIHFPATKESANRIIKMGEENWRVNVVGAPYLDIILNKKLPSRQELFKLLGNINPEDKFILLTQHPFGNADETKNQMREILSAIKTFNLPIFAIYPNADPGGKRIIKIINQEKNNPLFHIFPSLPYEQFLALEKEAAVWVGNSSGAMIESPTFKTPVVNVGGRQFNRQRGGNVIDVGYDRKEIIVAIDKSLNNKEYRTKIAKSISPWGDGKTGPRITKILENLKINARLLDKQITY